MIESVDLSKYSYAFSDNELTGLKSVNYFYGKNGSGKSSLVNAIFDQYSDEYDIHLFQGFDNLFGSNEQLNAIALGTTNKDATERLGDIDRQIRDVKGEIDPVEVVAGKNKNLYGKVKKAEDDYKEKHAEFLSELSEAAKTLKNKYTYLTSTTYNRTKLMVDLNTAKEVNQIEIEKQQMILNSSTIDLDDENVLQLPVATNFLSVLTETQGILERVVKPTEVIAELEGNSVKRAFAQEGMRIHNQEEGEKCAFCGNPISAERWELLDEYFSDAVQQLKERVDKQINLITSMQNNFKLEIILDDDKYQQKFEKERKFLEIKINKDRLDVQKFLSELLVNLEKKREDPFTIVKVPKISIPNGLSDDQSELEKLWIENSEFNKVLSQEQDKAKKILKGHYVSKVCSEFEYKKQQNNLNLLEVERDTLQKQLDEKRATLKNLQDSRYEVVKLTKNEEIAANKINGLIGSLGDDSFTLRHVSSRDGQKGLYTIVGRDGKSRSLSTLSTGEKNILSFLWFMYDLENVNNKSNHEKVIVFDDPINSNDDNSQYLILGELQALLQNQNKPQIFILTHNNQFYLQIKPTSGQLKKNRRAFRLRRNSKTKICEIGKGKDTDIKPIYENLWDELRYAYDNDKLDFMWNDMRRILESFGRFNYNEDSPRDIEKYTGNIENKVLFLALLKSLHVNSHVGYEPDIDLSGRNKEQLLMAFKAVFESLGYGAHFKIYW